MNSTLNNPISIINNIKSQLLLHFLIKDSIVLPVICPKNKNLIYISLSCNGIGVFINIKNNMIIDIIYYKKNQYSSKYILCNVIYTDLYKVLQKNNIFT